MNFDEKKCRKQEKYSLRAAISSIHFSGAELTETAQLSGRHFDIVSDGFALGIERILVRNGVNRVSTTMMAHHINFALRVWESTQGYKIPEIAYQRATANIFSLDLGWRRLLAQSLGIQGKITVTFDPVSGKLLRPCFEIKTMCDLSK